MFCNCLCVRLCLCVSGQVELGAREYKRELWLMMYKRFREDFAEPGHEAEPTPTQRLLRLFASGCINGRAAIDGLFPGLVEVGKRLLLQNCFSPDSEPCSLLVLYRVEAVLPPSLPSVLAQEVQGLPPPLPLPLVRPLPLPPPLPRALPVPLVASQVLRCRNRSRSWS